MKFNNLCSLRYHLESPWEPEITKTNAFSFKLWLYLKTINYKHKKGLFTTLGNNKNKIENIFCKTII